MNGKFVLVAGFVAAAAAACSDGDLEVFVERAATSAGATPSLPEPEVPSPSGGSGGTAPDDGGGAGAPPLATEPLVVDDFQDGNTQCLATDGYWYLVNDGTGWQELTFGTAPELVPTSQALHLRGGGFSQWGMALGLDLSGSLAVFDARPYRELRFRARAEPGSTTEIEVHILESDLHFSAAVALSPTWSDFALPLGSMFSPAEDPERTLNPASISAIQFFVLSDAPFDYWLDDVVLAP
jgi:hypothetical protein